MSKQKVALVGFGAIGRNHARNLAAFHDVELVVVETASEPASQARAAGYSVFSTLEQALSWGVKGVVLAVPTSLHHEMALTVIEAGIGVLVEKPVASTLSEGEAIIAAAKVRSVPLMIGYVERFNPAVVALKNFLTQGYLGRVFAISARRLGAMPARIKDANVLIDIGVHDIDVAAFLLDRPLELRSALGGRALIEDRLDFAMLSIDARGIAVQIESNWITPVKIRELYVTGENGICHIDYITQAARFAARRDIRLGATFEATVENYRHGEWTDLPVAREEPLKRELKAFVGALRGEALPDPAIALVSLRLAEEATARIEDALLAMSL